MILYVIFIEIFNCIFCNHNPRLHENAAYCSEVTTSDSIAGFDITINIEMSAIKS